MYSVYHVLWAWLNPQRADLRFRMVMIYGAGRDTQKGRFSGVHHPERYFQELRNLRGLRAVNYSLRSNALITAQLFRKRDRLIGFFVAHEPATYRISCGMCAAL